MRILAGATAMVLAYILAGQAMAETLTRPDGSAIHYSLYRPDGQAKGLILIAQGSGCLPTADNPSLASVRAVFADYAAVMVEKSGVTADSGIVDGFTDCPAAFHESYTVSGRVRDYEAVLAHLRGDPSLSAEHLVLFGGSEGGMAVARLASRVEPDATIILSSATGETLANVILSTLPPEAQAGIAAGMEAARGDPEGEALFAGSSHRFWADVLDARSLDYLLDSTGPILQIQGGRDLSSPPAASQATLRAFAAAGKCTLTYWEFAGLDHGMAMPDGTSRLSEVLAMAHQWAEAPWPAC